MDTTKDFNYADQILKIQKEMNPKPFDISAITQLLETYQQGQKNATDLENQQQFWEKTAPFL